MFSNSIIQKRRIVVLFFICIIVTSIVLATRLSVNLYPNVERTKVSLWMSGGGLSAQDFFEKHGKSLETALKNIKDVTMVQASYSPYYVSYQIIFDWGVKSVNARLLVNQTFTVLQNSLPYESQKSNGIETGNKSGGFMYITFSSQVLSNEDVYNLVNTEIEQQFQGISGVVTVDTIPIEELIITVTLRYEMLQRYKISLTMLQAQLNNQVIDSSIANISIDDNLINLRYRSASRSLYTIDTIEIAQVDGKILQLKDIADISIEYTSTNEAFLYNGKPAIAMVMTTENGADLRVISNEINTIIQTILQNNSLLSNITIDKVLDPAHYISIAIGNVIGSGALGALLAVIVVLLFLGQVKNTILIVLSIPFTIIMSLGLMYTFGITINMISLGGLTIATGMVLDASIVVIENIHRIHKQNPEMETKKLIAYATQQVYIPIIASVCTSIVVFLPLSFTAPLANAILGDLSKAIIFALFCSLIIALIIVPLSAFYLFRFINNRIIISRFEHYAERQTQKLIKIYRLSLEKFLNNFVLQILFLIIAISLFLFSLLFIAPRIEQSIIGKPSSDRIVLSVTVQPEYKDLSEFLLQVSKINDEVHSILGNKVKNIFSIVNRTSNVTILITLTSSSVGDWAIEKLNSYYNLNNTNANNTNANSAETKKNQHNFQYYVIPWDPAELPLPEYNHLRIEVTGKEQHEIFSIMNQIQIILGETEYYVRSIPWIITPQISFIMKPREEILEQFSGFNIQQELLALFNRVVAEFKVKNQETGDKYTVYVYNPQKQYTFESIRATNIITNNEIIPLYHFVDFYEEEQPLSLSSKNSTLEYAFTIDLAGTNVNPSDIKLAKQKIKTLLSENLKALPSGYNYNFVDTNIEMKKTIQSLLIALGLSIVLVFFVMTIQFNSYQYPIIILLTVPLGIIGSLFSLWLFKSTISLNSLLGFILLGGIVVNNAIIMIDFFLLVYKKYPHDKKQAIIEACSLRLIPILITMFTTFLGMLPLAFALGDGMNILQPLGIAVSGGLLISTQFTLYMIPLLLHYIKIPHTSEDMDKHYEIY